MPAIKFDHKAIDKKWQSYWEKKNIFKAEDFSKKDKFYCLVEFPYPSGDGLHVGHPRSYTALDILSRKKRMQGYNVLFPMGFDAFGLPSENYAIKTGIHPAIITRQNIEKFERQMRALGFSFDWDRVISTTDPKYFKWTQWIFIKLFQKGLAYKSKIAINWCLNCKIGLANEEVVNGKCERCGGDIEKRRIEQWMLKITDYAEKLLKDLDMVDFLEKIKIQQVNWIGRSEGANVDFKIVGSDQSINVFTTRPDTLFGATYIVLSPEHELVREVTTSNQKQSVDKYIKYSARRSDLERTELSTVKTGISTGSYAVNSVNNEKIPIWIADYVLTSYGTGAIMAVPAHDMRDFEFAEKFNLEIRCIVQPDKKVAQKKSISIKSVLEGKICWPFEGKSINSANDLGLNINGLEVTDAIKKTTEWIEEQGIGKSAVNYKLRDWVFSRQRYWGEPIPMIYCENCGWNPVPIKDLPVMLPDVERYELTDSGESPLANITNWVNTTCPVCDESAKRETDTMPNWAGSSWYYLRYIDPENDLAIADKSKLEYWMPVDWYNGGMDHTTLHLLYSRFWNKFLYDCGIVPVSEPYLKRTSHGMILGESGEKMSKSRDNVINPDEVVENYGADVFRLYEMFIGPFDQSVAWNTKGIVGINRFIGKVWRFYTQSKIEDVELTGDQLRILHSTIKKVSEDIETLDLNTAVSQLMICINEFTSFDVFPKSAAVVILKLLSPFAPHICEELWNYLGNDDTIAFESWPIHNEKYLNKDAMSIAIQVNGKLRSTIEIPANISEEEAIYAAKNDEKIARYLNGREVRKEIYIQGRLINIVIK